MVLGSVLRPVFGRQGYAMKTKSAVLGSELSSERDFISNRVFCQFNMHAGAIKNEISLFLKILCSAKRIF